MNNYYDNYDFLTDRNKELVYEDRPGYGKRYNVNDYSAKGLLTGTYVNTIPAGWEGALDEHSALYYDDRGRLIQSRKSRMSGEAFDNEYLAYNFQGQPVKRLHEHLMTDINQTSELYSYEYDHAGRLIETRHKLNERNEVVIARNTYDELGRLISEQANGQEGLQTDYSYNIRSWTTNLNNSVYRESIEYNNIGNVIYMNEYRHSKRPQYYWEVSMEYDDLSRMTSYADAGYGAAPTTFFEYDKHGNIIYIDRSGVTAEDSYDSCDELTITHSGNQVQSVVDATDCSETYYSYDFRNLTGVGTSASYEYDLNGAVTKDPYKGATIINNSLNLPQQITVNNNLASGSITYVYLATGEKIMASSSVSLRRSLNPAEIAGGVSTMASTDRDEATFYFGNIIYKTTPEGEPYLDKILIDNGYIKDGEYYFYIKDHLGNNRATAFSTGSVKGMDDYFPYGMPVIDSKWGKNPQAYRFGGKELERLMGLNLYDFQARWHDPALGRFMSVDPLCEKYYSISPYAYCMNNPIKYIDPNGKDWIVANGTSNYEWRNDITAESTIPKGYQYVGANDSDILSHLGLPTSFLEYSSNRIGSIASDAEVGRYAVSHMINVKEKSNATIDVNVSYTREGRIFNGVEIKVTNVSSNSGLDGNIENVGLVNVQYGDKAYTSTLKTPDSPQLLEAGSSVKTSTVNIPKLDLYRGNDFLQIKVEGNWWITTPGGKTPIVAHPVAPIPISFKHLWTK
ncbi:RHS repeat domain-containing protein [Bacteroides nordii]|jgi:cell well associated rhsD protein|uniref:RHS repeat domain-containing protein n=2 Tax=Bacteroides TaxID=816 RepID=UPI0022E47241|nr:RHS repeat-associated core domain-containing protein [Bacteroides nordii]